MTKNSKKEPVCLWLIAETYNKFKKLCSKQLSSASREFNLFMQSQLAEEKKKEEVK